MKLTRTKELLEKIMTLEIPISNTSKGKQVHQTYRNNLTAKLNEALYEDCAESLLGDSDILPYLVKGGVILEVPNVGIADSLDKNDLGSGAISIELSITIKSLETDANELANEYDFKKQLDIQKAEKKEKDKLAKIERDKKARELKERKKNKMLEMVNSITEKTVDDK